MNVRIKRCTKDNLLKLIDTKVIGNECLKVSIVDSDFSTAYVGFTKDTPEIIVLCERSEWDSTFFETEISKFSIIQTSDDYETSSTLVERCIQESVKSQFENEIQCIITRIPIGNYFLHRVLERVGFGTYDIGWTLRKNIDEESVYEYDDESIEIASQCDLWRLISLSSQLFHHDHFHNDEKFENGSADSMYGIWVKNLFYNEKCKITIIKESNDIIGFITLRELESKSGNGEFIIDLIGVSKHHTGKGIGKRLLEWSFSQVPNGSNITIGTQISNLPAIRLYLGTGFVPIQSYATLHLWQKNFDFKIE